MNDFFTIVTGPIVMGWFLFPAHFAVYSAAMMGIGIMTAKVMRL